MTTTTDTEDRRVQNDHRRIGEVILDDVRIKALDRALQLNRHLNLDAATLILEADQIARYIQYGMLPSEDDKDDTDE